MTDDPGGGASRSTDPASGTSTATDVSLREYVAMQIGYERRGSWMLIGGVFAFGAFAWSEIQRRLVNLNHEAARIQAAQSASVSADTYKANEQQRESEAAELQAWRKEVDRDRTQSVSREELTRETRGDRQIFTGNVIALLGIVALIGAALLGHYIH